MLTAMAIVRPLIADSLKLATGFEIGLEVGLEVGLVARLELEFELADAEVISDDVAEMEAVKTDVLGDGDGDESLIDVAVPTSDPMKKRFIAFTPAQQLPLCAWSLEPTISQHMNPPSAAHLSEQFHTTAPAFLKS